jgi:hypothetical protein
MAAAVVICWLRCSISFFENAGTGAEAGLNLRQSKLSISLPDEKVAGALQ